MRRKKYEDDSQLWEEMPAALAVNNGLDWRTKIDLYRLNKELDVEYKLKKLAHTRHQQGYENTEELLDAIDNAGENSNE